MNWLQLSLPSTKEQVDAWSDTLVEIGAVAVTLEEDAQQPIYQLGTEHLPLWDNVNLVALFNEDQSIESTMLNLAGSIPADTLSQAKWKTIVEEDWQLKWQENLQPMTFGNNLWVCPSWCAIPDPNAVNIMLDPEMAFGTGTHPTTALCLEWIAQNMQAQATVIDYGCGSGILAIAAVKMGAKQVYAIDIDQTALDVSANNASKNQVSLEQFKTFLPEQVPVMQADIMIANILAHPLIDLAPTLVALLKPHGTIVLSGILAEQAEAIKTRYSQWFKDFTVTHKDEWVRITATQKRVAIN